MYNLCCQHLQSLKSVQQKLIVYSRSKICSRWAPQRSRQTWIHLARVVIALTRPEPPRNLYLWGYLKDRVYKHNPQTIPDPKAAIRPIPREEEGTLPVESKSACNGGGRTH